MILERAVPELVSPVALPQLMWSRRYVRRELATSRARILKVINAGGSAVKFTGTPVTSDFARTNTAAPAWPVMVPRGSASLGTRRMACGASTSFAVSQSCSRAIGS